MKVVIVLLSLFAGSFLSVVSAERGFRKLPSMESRALKKGKKKRKKSSSKGSMEQGNDGDDGSGPAKDPLQVTFMTRNLYLGADTNPIGFATSPQEAIQATMKALAVVEATNFTARAQAIASEVAETQPDFIGMQEVTLYTFVDAATQSIILEDEFLPTLLGALHSQGVSYSLASEYVAQTIGPLPTDFTFTNAVIQRLSNVILVKDDADIAVLSEAQGRFSDQFLVETVANSTIDPNRGYQYIDVLMGGTIFRVANTHLEREQGPAVGFNVLQGQELSNILQDGYDNPVVLIGDIINSSPGEGTAFDLLTQQENFKDSWEEADDEEDLGLTCCHVADLASTTQDLFGRFDVIFLRHQGASDDILKVKSAVNVGDEQFQGFQPIFASDHVGVVATIQFGN